MKSPFSHPLSLFSHPLSLFSHPLSLFSHPLPLFSHPLSHLPALLTLLLALALPAAAQPVRVLVVTGGHDYDTSFYTLFEQPGIAWKHAVSNKEAFRRDIRNDVDVLVLYDMTSDLDEAGKQHLREFVESGKGLVVMHHALIDYTDWPWWYRDVVGGKYLEKPENGLPASTYKHDQTLTITPQAKHPVLTGIKRFTLEDETYGKMWVSDEVQVLLTTDHPESTRQLAWISPYEKSRVVAIQPGHGTPSHWDRNFRRLVRNAILWSAGRMD